MRGIYIAAPGEFQELARGLARQLSYMGRGLITSRWLTEDLTQTPAHKFAEMDLKDIDAADVIVVLNPPGWERQGTGGRHTELGYALCKVVRGDRLAIIVVGEVSNVFHAHDKVRRVPWADSETLFEVIADEVFR